MREYREISVGGDERPQRRDTAPGRPAPRRRPPATDWQALALAGLGGTVRLCRTQPGSVLGSLAVLGAVTAVCVNALGSQAGRHPAPILPKPAVVAAARAPLPREAARPAPERPAEVSRPAEPVRTAEGRPETRREQGRSDTKPDPIAALIRSEETTASVSPKDTAVLQAQRALNRLGYGPLKADGMMGPGTRAAIEKFERAAKLPVKGEPAGPTLRALTQKAGQG